MQGWLWWAHTAVSYLFPSIRPTGRTVSTTPHSGASLQASCGIPVRRTMSFGGTISSVSCQSKPITSRSPSVGQSLRSAGTGSFTSQRGRWAGSASEWGLSVPDLRRS